MKKSQLLQLIREEIKEDITQRAWDYVPISNPKKEKEDYPHSAPRVYVLMLGNRHRGVMGPYRVYADKAEAKAEAARQEASGNDTRAFVQDLAFIK